MGRITLQPLIELYKEYGYSVYKDGTSYVLMNKDSDKVMIPKYEEDSSEFITTVNLKFNRLIKAESEENKIEELKFKRDILLLSADSQEDKVSFRIPDVKKASLDFIKKICSKFYSLAEKYWSIAWDSSFQDDMNFLQTTEGSFVINISLPKQENWGNALLDWFDINETFINIISEVSEDSYDNINLGGSAQELKAFVSKLREFSEEILWKTELYLTNKEKTKKVVSIISDDQKENITNFLKEFEDHMISPLTSEQQEFSINMTANPTTNRIAKVIFLGEFQGSPSEFRWSWMPNAIFRELKRRDAEQDWGAQVILKNIQFIKLRNYYRILSAELERAN